MGRDGSKRTAVLQGVDRSVLVRPLQMVIPLEYEPGRVGCGGSLELSVSRTGRDAIVSVVKRDGGENTVIGFTRYLRKCQQSG